MSGGPGRARPGLLLLGLIALLLAAAPSIAGATPSVHVTATVETAPMHHAGDAADDPAIWIHPSDPSLSTIIGTDKEVGGGLVVYDLAGNELFFYADGRENNVDVRYNFPLGTATVSIVGATNRLMGRMDFWRVDPVTRGLSPIGNVPTSSAIVTPRGFSFYVSPVSGKYYAFVSDSGNTDEYELSGASGSVTGKLVRQFKSTVPHTEGLVADDELGRIYLAEEDAGGIWRYGGEPGDSNTGTIVERTIENGGSFIQDVKGLGLYYGANCTGYLIAASQGGNSFHVYNRGDNAKVGEFDIVAPAGSTDKVTGMDGIDVTNFGLGSAFPSGVFVTQDTTNEGGGNQNFKLVPWQSIANGFAPHFLIDSTWDPRLIGGPGGAGVGTCRGTPAGGGTPPAGGGTPTGGGGTPTGGSGTPTGTGTTATATGAAPTTPAAAVSGAVGPKPVDVKAPTAKLSGSRSQKLGSTIAITIGCADEACRATTDASVSVPRVGSSKARDYALQVVTRSIARGAKSTVRLRLSATARRAILRALKAHKRVVVTVDVTVKDGAGNEDIVSRDIKITR